VDESIEKNEKEIMFESCGVVKIMEEI